MQRIAASEVANRTSQLGESGESRFHRRLVLRLEKQLLAKPWQEARPGVSVKLLAEDDELYVYAESVDRVSKSLPGRRPGNVRCAGGSSSGCGSGCESWLRWQSRARKC